MPNCRLGLDKRSVQGGNPRAARLLVAVSHRTISLTSARRRSATRARRRPAARSCFADRRTSQTTFGKQQSRRGSMVQGHPLSRPSAANAKGIAIQGP